MEESDREQRGLPCREVDARTSTELGEDSPWTAHEDNHHSYKSLESHPYWLVKSSDRSRGNANLAEAFDFCESALQYRGVPSH